MSARFSFRANLALLALVSICGLLLVACSPEEPATAPEKSLHAAQAICGGQLRAAVIAQNGKLSKVVCK